jgi:hypothetical protein
MLAKGADGVESVGGTTDDASGTSNSAHETLATSPPPMPLETNRRLRLS